MLKEAHKTSRRKTLRANRTKVKIGAHAMRPRLVVHRSNKFIYAQIINSAGQVLASANSSKLKGKTPIDRAKEVGQLVAAAAKLKDVMEIAFDRRSYKYHGQVKALAEGARDGGLIF